MTAISRAFRLILAFFVIIGMSGQSFGGLLCASGACPDSCSMHEQKAPPEQTPTCCPTKPAKDSSNKAPSGKCDCKIKAAPDVTQSAPTVASAHVPVLLAMPSDSIDSIAHAVALALGPTLYSGNSPPSVVRHPDLGRAPPAA
jgi:hypothetical protein